MYSDQSSDKGPTELYSDIKSKGLGKKFSKKIYYRYCSYCDASFTTKNHRSKYCGDLCRKEGRKLYRRELAAKKKKEGICSHCLARPNNGYYACDRCRESNNVSSKNRKKTLISKGLCRDCGNPASQKLCSPCSLKNNQRSKLDYILLKERNRCTYCRTKLNKNCKFLMCRNCLDMLNEKNLEVKREVLSHYGGNCQCCGIANLIFLSLDHIKNDGAKDRKKHRRTGINLYKYLRKNGFPSGFQTFCHNCNLGKSINNGICPHNTVIHTYTPDCYRTKTSVMNHYGNTCACCGESNLRFLTIDHINGGGRSHREQLGIASAGHNFYCWLIREKFPEEFQTLCINCNIAKHINNGICPHNLVS